MLNKLNSYIALSKPGIIWSNLFIAITGYFLASFSVFLISDFLWFVISFILILASSTSLNNYIDKDIDKNLSARTKSRSLKIENLGSKEILIFGLFSGLVGFSIMFLKVNTLAFILSLIAFIIYVGLYSMWAKRTTYQSTFIGSFSGAAPPLIGYVAFANFIDIDGLLLFLVLFAWQMYHFFAIAIFRVNDYKNVNVPLLSVVKGTKVTAKHLVYWGFVSILFSILLKLFSNLGYIYLFYALTLLFVKTYIFVSYNKYCALPNGEYKWARKVFFISIIDVLALGIAIILDSILL